MQTADVGDDDHTRPGGLARALALVDEAFDSCDPEVAAVLEPWWLLLVRQDPSWRCRDGRRLDPRDSDADVCALLRGDD